MKNKKAIKISFYELIKIFLWVNKSNFFFNFISLQIIIYDYYDFGLNRKYVDKGSINRKNNIIE